jgi:DNA mismatch repair protein MSH6
MNKNDPEFFKSAETRLPYFVQPGYVKDEDGRTPDDPEYDPSTLHIPI